MILFFELYMLLAHWGPTPGQQDMKDDRLPADWEQFKLLYFFNGALTFLILTHLLIGMVSDRGKVSCSNAVHFYFYFLKLCLFILKIGEKSSGAEV